MRLLTLLATVVLALGATAVASAHVTPTPSKAAAGSYTVVSFSVGHGCEGSPTRQVSVQIPRGIESAKPRPKAGWKVEVTRVKLAKPVKSAHGATVTNRVGVITWSGGLLRDDWFGTFEISFKFPETAGRTMYFPVVQRCVKGVTRWIQIPQGEAEPDRPAPGVLLTKATGGHS